MKSFLRIAQILISLAVMLSSSANGQSAVAYPAWIAQGFQDVSFVPPAYAGTALRLVKLQLLSKTHMNEFDMGITVQWSPHSGVIGIVDDRGLGSVKTGWDTGRDGVYFMTRVSGGEVFPIKYLCVLRDSLANRCRCVWLTIDSTIGVSQSVPFADSAVGVDWGAAGIVAGSLYVYDLTEARIRRYLDTDSDEFFELLDISFSLCIPTQWTPSGGALASFGRIAKFSPPATAGSVLRLSMIPREYQFDIFEAGGVVNILLPPSPSSDHIVLGIAGRLVGGQERLYVFGSPEVTYKICKVTGSGQEEPISKMWTIDSGGNSIVDLTEPLVAGVSVLVVSEDNDHRSVIHTPVVAAEASLLRPTERRFVEGELYYFQGDRLTESLQAYAIFSDGSITTATTKWLESSRQIRITLPDMGNPGVGGDHRKIAEVSIVLKDETTGAPKSQAVTLPVFYD